MRVNYGGIKEEIKSKIKLSTIVEQGELRLIKLQACESSNNL